MNSQRVMEPQSIFAGKADIFYDLSRRAKSIFYCKLMLEQMLNFIKSKFKKTAQQPKYIIYFHAPLPTLLLHESV